MMLRAAILFYVIALFCFYTIFAFGQDYYDWIYYIWDKTAGGSFLSWCALYSLSKRDKTMIAPLVWFSFFRALWDVISLKTGITAANDWRVASLFLLLTFTVALIAFRSESKIAIFLDKTLKSIRL